MSLTLTADDWQAVAPTLRLAAVSTGLLLLLATLVLMIGGNIPGVSRVLSVQIYDHVEAIDYAAAHRLAALMLVFAFAALLALYVLGGRRQHAREWWA